jgi:pSer/pThr/pTyr-binding forkhead associated (FHA) protein
VGTERNALWAPHTSTPIEIKERLEAERTGLAHVVFRDGSAEQVLVWLAGDKVTVGRLESTGICLNWDMGVSRIHAELERVGDIWTLSDDGLSRNGSSVNGKRVIGRRRLEDGDALTFGSTTVIFRAPSRPYDRTESARALMKSATVSPSELCVLIALCRPLQSSDRSSPATNREIAGELFLSVPAVKRRLGVLFDRFGFENLSHNEKRARLAEVALSTGLVVPVDFMS